MAAQVAPGAMDVICDYADGFVVRVRGAADVDAALTALAAARDDIVALAAHAGDPDAVVVSQPVLGPDGPLLRVDRLDVDDDVLVTVPGLVVRRLEAAGVGDGVVDAPQPGGSLDALDTCRGAVVLRLFPPPAGTSGVLPVDWIDIACEWVLGGLAADDSVRMRLLGIELEVPVADAPAVVHQASLAKAWCDVVNGTVDDRVRTASITFGGAAHVALAAGGPGCDSQALVARFDLLAEVARELAGDVCYACIDIEPTFEGIGLGLASTGWRDQDGASPNVVAGELCDVLVPDAYPFQILGKGHLARLDDEGVDLRAPALVEAVSDGRVAVLIGQAAEWLPGARGRDMLQVKGWDLFRPLLATESEVEALLRRRPGRQVDEEPSTGSDPPATSAVPDLDDIVLETLPHSRRGLHLTFLELVSWLAHEHHSDAPACTSPVAATYARWFASALDDDRRQDLKSRARAIIGTGTTPPGSDGVRVGALAPGDTRRAWQAADWLVRVQAVAWLRLAELTQAAGRLESLGPVTDQVTLMRAVDVLGAAISIVGRRLDLTASIAGAERLADGDLVEQASWDAWERASEAAGWVAASEAAALGVPAELAYATDLRVIECARDARIRADLEASRRSIGDLAWAAALHAMADEAWRVGWAAAHSAVEGQGVVVPLRTALGRAARAVAERAGVDDDQREQAVEAAEAEAKSTLTRLALAAAEVPAGEHAWDAALAAAAGVEGGELWSMVQQMARDAVGEEAWAAGMAAARDAVAEILAEGPDVVARAVSAAMAREAAGAAARGVALRAAAISRARGGSAGDAARAAEDVLAATVRELQDSAFALLDAMLATGEA